MMLNHINVKLNIIVPNLAIGGLMNNTQKKIFFKYFILQSIVMKNTIFRIEHCCKNAED